MNIQSGQLVLDHLSVFVSLRGELKAAKQSSVSDRDRDFFVFFLPQKLPGN